MSWTKVARSSASTGLELASVRAIDFVDSSHGWLLLQGGCGTGSCSHEILRTTNGGTTWARVEWNYVSQSSRSALPACDGVANNMEFLSRTSGWVTGMCGAATQEINVYRTGNGGRTWQLQKHMLSARGLVSHVTYFNPGLPSPFTRDGCSILPVDIASPASFQLLSTCNGGVFWVPTKPIRAVHQKFGPNTAYDVLSYHDVWARVRGKLYRTTSAMSGWQVVSSHPNLGASPQLDFVNPNVGFVAQTMGASQVLMTTDAGRTWTSHRTPWGPWNRRER